MPGDIIEDRGDRFVVVGRPFVGQTGASIFDRFELFWRVRLRPLDGRGPASHYGTWPIGTEVVVIEQGAPPTGSRRAPSRSHNGLTPEDRYG